MTTQRKAEIKLWALTLIGSLSLAAGGGLFGRTVALLSTFVILEVGVVIGVIVWNEFKSGGMIRRRP